MTAAKLADGAVTNAKLADNSVSAAKLQDGAVTAAKLAPNAVARASIQDEAVSRAKLAFQEVAAASTGIGPNGATTVLVRSNVPQAQTAFFFPMLTITATTSGPPTSFGQVEAFLQYRRAGLTAGDVVDVHLRLTNAGSMGVQVAWRVVTFAP